jgi:hypothetical protein
MAYRTLVVLFDGNHQYARLLIDEFFIRPLQKNLLHQKLVFVFGQTCVWSLHYELLHTQV